MQDKIAADSMEVEWLLRLYQLQADVEREPEKAGPWAVLADYLSRKGRQKEALAAYSEALALEANSPDLLTKRAAIRLEMDQFQEAIEDCTRAVEAGAGRTAWSIRGDAWLKLGQADRALGDYELAMRIDEQVGEAFLLRAAQRVKTRDFEMARADLDQARALAPKLEARIRELLKSIPDQ